MPLKDLLSADSVYAGLRVSSVNRLLVRLATALALPHGLEVETVYQGLLAREQLSSTALGHGVALPHAAIPGLQQIGVVFARLDRRLAMGAPDGEPVDLVCALIVPDLFIDQKLRLLAEIAEILGSENKRRALRSAADEHALLAVLTRA